MMTEASADFDMNQRSKLERHVCIMPMFLLFLMGRQDPTHKRYRPIRQVPQRLAPSQREIAEKEMNKMLDQGTIEPSDSLWAAPIVLVAKKDGTTRF